jgi:hypothetical protein
MVVVMDGHHYIVVWTDGIKTMITVDAIVPVRLGPCGIDYL